ncbi:MAG: dienelactone hydrolase family protein [Acidobacteriota bacterium]
MCDQHFEEDLANYMRFPPVTRRQFAAASIGAGIAVILPRAADALDVKETDLDVKTPDGVADCYFVHPASGASPGVIVWPDILGLRPAFRQMGKRLAESGYAVLVVNPFYRQKKAPVVPAGASFADQATRDIVMPLAQGLNATTHMTDAKAFVAFLDSQAAVDKKRKIGTTGYCMGGPIVMRTAAAVPDRVGAGASFHGGGLVTKNPDSPHLLIPSMKAHFLFAVAENDDQRDPEAKNVLREWYAKAKLPAEIEVYAGAAHGWCPPDSAVYNEKQAERAWARLLVLFKQALA